VQPPATVTRLRRSTVASFRSEPEEVRRVRAALRRELDGCPAADDIILCASELAANAVLHSDSRKASGTFTVRAVVSPGEYVLIEVQDDGGPWLERSVHPASGRGLGIVSALAADWGSQATAYGRTVWASFDWSACA